MLVTGLIDGASPFIEFTVWGAYRQIENYSFEVMKYRRAHNLVWRLEGGGQRRLPKEVTSKLKPEEWGDGRKSLAVETEEWRPKI